MYIACVIASYKIAQTFVPYLNAFDQHLAANICILLAIFIQIMQDLLWQVNAQIKNVYFSIHRCEAKTPLYFNANLHSSLFMRPNINYQKYHWYIVRIM